MHSIHWMILPFTDTNNLLKPQVMWNMRWACKKRFRC